MFTDRFCMEMGWNMVCQAPSNPRELFARINGLNLYLHNIYACYMDDRVIVMVLVVDHLSLNRTLALSLRHCYGQEH